MCLRILVNTGIVQSYLVHEYRQFSPERISFQCIYRLTFTTHPFMCLRIFVSTLTSTVEKFTGSVLRNVLGVWAPLSATQSTNKATTQQERSASLGENKVELLNKYLRYRSSLTDVNRQM